MALGRDGKDVSPYPYLLVHEQNKTEQMLLDDLAGQTGPKGAYGVERNTEVVGLEQAPDNVSVTLRHEDGAEEVLKARYLIAADGASSFVRQALGLEFDSATYADPLFVTDVDMTWPLDRDTFYAQVPRQGMLTFFPMRGDGYSDTQYRIHRRMTKQFRVGNIFLAGDAAHIHSPAGGRG